MATVPGQKSRGIEGLAFRIAILYAGMGSLWIFFSDEAARFLFPSPEAFARASMLKGWFYVLLTALLLHVLVKRGVRALQASREALRFSEESYRAVVDKAGSIILRMDLQGRITFLNEFALEFFGVTREEVIGGSLAGTMVRRDDDAGKESTDPVLELLENPEGHPFQQEEAVRADGARVWIAWTNTVVRPGGGAPEILRVGNDVTEQKRLADALHERERRLGQVLENANDGYFDWDLVKDESFFSPRYYRMLGYEPGEFPASYRNFLKLVHPECFEEVRNVMAAMRRSAEDAFNVEFRMRTKNGRWKWILSRGHIAARDADGNTTRFVGIHIDITERKQAEEVLERYRLLVAQSRDIILLVRREDGRILEANRAATIAYGRTRDELLDMTIHDLRAKDTRPLTTAQMTEADIHGILFETVHWKVDGSVFPVEVSSRGATLGGERILVSVVRDVTERMRAENALRASEERLRLAQEAASAGSWEWDLDTGENHWSEELWHLYGLEPHSRDPSYETWRDSIHPDDLERVERTVRDASRAGEKFDTEWRVRLEDGTERWLNSRGRPFRAPDGHITRYIGIVIDVTERKRTETALRQWADAFEFCAHGIAIGDPRTGRILVCNPAFARLHGRAVEEVAGMPILDVHSPDSRAMVLRHISEADTRGGARFESFMKRPDGSMIAVQVDLVSVRDEAGNLLYRVATVQDISERKRAENELRESIEEKDALLREVHHRVKNNLQIVASLLNLQAGRSGNAHVIEVLRETRNRVHSMALLHEVLYRSGNLARINFNAYVEELCRHLLRAYGSSAGAVRIDNRVARMGLPLEQSVPCGLIINELVSNALKHAFPDGRAGTITIELEPVGEEGIVLAVRDDGAGFPPGMDVGSSSTLGLRLVSNLASQLSGRLELEKPPGETGAAFRLFIPFPEGTRSRGAS